MKIHSVNIQNFRSIIDSDDISIHPEITTFFGHNDTGKTSSLHAIMSMSPDYSYAFEDLSSYSTHAINRRNANEIQDKIPMVTMVFKIDERDRAKLIGIDQKFANQDLVKVTKFFDNSYEIQFEDSDSKIKIDSEGNTNSVIQDNIPELIQNIKQVFEYYLVENPKFDSNMALVDDALGYAANVRPNDQISSEAIIAELMEKFKKMDIRSQAVIAEINNFLQKYAAELMNFTVTDNISGSDMYDFLHFIPQFHYFEDFPHLDDKVSIQEVLLTPEKHPTFSKLIQLIGIDLSRISELNDYEVLRLENNASYRLTNLLNKYWSQDSVSLRIKISEGEITVYVQDPTGALDPPSNRSKGFRWFLAFQLNFIGNILSSERSNHVIMFDDPGVYLHPAGQKDLLQIFQDISGKGQVLFSTISPFMIDLEKVDRVKRVSKEKNMVGTRFFDLSDDDKKYLKNLNGVQGE